MIVLTEKETERLNTIKDVIGGNCTKTEASEKLEISIRQINRLIIKYTEVEIIFPEAQHKTLRLYNANM